MTKLKKELTVSGLTMIAIGSCIGSGIFISSSDSFKYIGHHGYVLLAWFLGGLVAYFGAMTFSELSSRFPNAGGVYVFLKEAYGELPGFLYGWIILLIVNTGALAALSVGFVDFLGFFFTMTPIVKTITAVLTILILTLINVIGIDVSQIFAKLFTGMKLLALVLIILLGLSFYNSPSLTHEVNFNFIEVPDGIISVMLLAFVGVFWSFGGWHHATYLAGEAKDPQRTVPKSMLYGTLIVTLVYILTLLAYSLLLPIDQLSASHRVAGDAVANVISGGGKLVTLAVSISIFGTIGIYTMTAPRIYYVMAKDSIFFPALSKLHPKFKTPYVAMIFQAVWASLLILIWGSFSKLITFVTFIDILFMMIAAISIFIFRKRDLNKGVNTNNGYKLKWYPIIPLFYIIVTFAFVVNTSIEMKQEAFAGLAILLAGIPVYYIFKKTIKKK